MFAASPAPTVTSATRPSTRSVAAAFAWAFFTPASASFQKSDEALTTKASFGLSWAMAPDDSATPAASAAARVIRDFM